MKFTQLLMAFCPMMLAAPLPTPGFKDEVVGAATQPAVKVSLERVGGYAERATNKVYNEAERHGSDFYRGTTDRFRDSVQITDKDRQNAREGRPLVSSSWGGSRW
jgi:hypothetical protein